MGLTDGRMTAALLFVLAFARVGAPAAACAPQDLKLPNPVLALAGTEVYQAGGKNFIRYMYTVDNSSAYPDTLFAAAPELPPCGSISKASRTWVEIYDQGGKRLYGFCALGKSSDLNKLWFGLEEGVIPPSWVYIEMNDRQTNTKYKSNLAETSL